jgi:hypothetical protein
MEDDARTAKRPIHPVGQGPGIFARFVAKLGAAMPGGRTAGFWHSDTFWKGVVVGLLTVVLIKTLIAVQAPYGIDWYGG